MGPANSLGVCIEVVAGMIAAMFAFAACWNYLKRRKHSLFRVVQLSASGVFLYLLFTRDF